MRRTPSWSRRSLRCCVQLAGRSLSRSPTSIWGERGSIDILAYHRLTGIVLVVEVKSVVPDSQATAHSDRKARLRGRSPRRSGWLASHVASWSRASSATARRSRSTDWARRRHARSRSAGRPSWCAGRTRWTMSGLCSSHPVREHGGAVTTPSTARERVRAPPDRLRAQGRRDLMVCHEGRPNIRCTARMRMTARLRSGQAARPTGS